MSDNKMREAFKAHYGWDFSDPDCVVEAHAWHAAWQAVLAQSDQRGEVAGWYCPQCQQGFDPAEVTFGETHVYCGSPVTDSPAPPAPVVPDGWKLVPVEPTDEMINAGCDASNAYRVDMDRSYQAMLAAAPEVKP